MAYFPMFVNLTDANCLVVGGGKVALRKIEVLLDYEAKVKAVAPVFCEEILELQKEHKEALLLVQRPYTKMDLSGVALVVAATDDKELNHTISIAARAHQLPVNAVDQKEDCTFIFPAYVKEGELVGAVSSGGNSPVMAQRMKQKLKDEITPYMGQVNEYLGQVRPLIQAHFTEEKDRKLAFQTILEYALREEKLPTEEELWQLFQKE